MTINIEKLMAISFEHRQKIFNFAKLQDWLKNGANHAHFNFEVQWPSNP